MIQALVAGVIAGGIYALVALGIVVVYRTTRVLNVAIGELATFGLLVSWTVVESWGASYLLGATAALLVVVCVALAFERAVARHLAGGPALAGLVATAGLATLLLGIEGKLWSADGRVFSESLDTPSIQVAGLFVTGWELATLLIAAALAGALMLFLQRSWFGLAIRATADDLEAARGVGMRVERVSAAVWACAGLLAATAGLLLRPTIGFIAPGLLTGLFVRGLAAALLAGLASPGGAVVGGLVVGVVEAVVAYAFIDTGFDGARSLAVLLLITGALLIRRRVAAVT